MAARASVLTLWTLQTLIPCEENVEIIAGLLSLTALGGGRSITTGLGPVFSLWMVRVQETWTYASSYDI